MIICLSEAYLFGRPRAPGTAHYAGTYSTVHTSAYLRMLKKSDLFVA
jgi:hypothetical protein